MYCEGDLPIFFLGGSSVASSTKAEKTLSRIASRCTSEDGGIWRTPSEEQEVVLQLPNSELFRALKVIPCALNWAWTQTGSHCKSLSTGVMYESVCPPQATALLQHMLCQLSHQDSLQRQPHTECISVIRTRNHKGISNCSKMLNGIAVLTPARKILSYLTQK